MCTRLTRLYIDDCLLLGMGHGTGYGVWDTGYMHDMGYNG